MLFFFSAGIDFRRQIDVPRAERDNYLIAIGCLVEITIHLTRFTTTSEWNFFRFFKLVSLFKNTL